MKYVNEEILNNVSVFLNSNERIYKELLQLLKERIAENINFENPNYEYFKQGQLDIINIVEKIKEFKFINNNKKGE